MYSLGRERMKSHAWAMSTNETPMNTENSSFLDTRSPVCALATEKWADTTQPTTEQLRPESPTAAHCGAAEAQHCEQANWVVGSTIAGEVPADLDLPPSSFDDFDASPLDASLSDQLDASSILGPEEPPPLELMRQLDDTLRSIRLQQLHDLLIQFSAPCPTDPKDLLSLLSAVRELRSRIYTNTTATPLTHNLRRQTLRQIDTLVGHLDPEATDGSAGEASPDDDGRNLAPAFQASLQTCAAMCVCVWCVCVCVCVYVCVCGGCVVYMCVHVYVDVLMLS
jgi:hypothetical protein